jgi:hypothetical protein
MKTFKAICAASVLALTLCVPANAGDIQLPGKPTPTPPPATAPENTGLTAGATTVDGDITFLALADMLWKLASIF